MSKGKKSKRREKLAERGQESLEAIARGDLIPCDRPESLVRMMDTAISLWLADLDEFSTHLLVVICFTVLRDLAGDSGKGPRYSDMDVEAVYDFLRHASPKTLMDSVDLPYRVTPTLALDVIGSFERIYGWRSSLMATFAAWFVIDKRKSGLQAAQQDISYLLPPGASLGDLIGLNRVAFFKKLEPLFRPHSGRPPEKP